MTPDESSKWWCQYEEERRLVREAIYRFWGLDPEDEDLDEKLYEAGKTAGREWAHARTGDFQMLQRVAADLERVGELEWPFWHLGMSIAGVLPAPDAADDAWAAIWDDDATRDAVARVQTVLLSPCDGDFYQDEGPGSYWTWGFAAGVHEVWQETRDWLARQALDRLKP